MNNKGYTLVEVLSVFVILGIIIMISVPIVSGVINTSKEKAYDEQVKILEEATRTYMSRNSKELPLYEDEKKCITVETLKNNGFIKDKVIKNPVGRTSEHVEKDEFFDGGVLVTYKNNKYTYKYVDDCGNTVQDDGNGGFTPTASKFTGTIYRWRTKTANNGASISNIGEYTTNASTLNKTYYLKHDVADDIITASYVCFVYNNAEHCMKGGDNGASFAANTQTIKDFQTFNNLPDNANPGCYFYSGFSSCDGGGFDQVNASSDGDVSVGGSSGCSVYAGGNSDCGVS